jgi:predicted MFS family arabinose efflux permease
MVLAAPAIFPHVAPSRRGAVAGVVFMGVGFGITLSGTLVPLLLSQGIVETWLGLGIVALLFTAAGWRGWLADPEPEHAAARPHGSLPVGSLRGLYAIYGLIAFALVPHMVFLVAFIAQGLGQGLALGTGYWVLFGLGAILGPLLAGRAVDTWGARNTLVAVLGLQCVFVALPAMSSIPAALISSSVIMGACTIGVVPIVLARTRGLLRHHPAARFRAWRTATASFALFQALGAYALSFLFAWSQGNYQLLFTAGAVATSLALLVALLTQRAADS